MLNGVNVILLLAKSSISYNIIYIMWLSHHKMKFVQIMKFAHIMKFMNHIINLMHIKTIAHNIMKNTYIMQ